MYPKQKHFVIVDGHHLLYRAYWAIPRSMKMNNGEQVNTAFGVAGMLMTILKKEEPDAILFCFDADEDTFRHTEYAEYKAGRSATPDDFYPQVPKALSVIDAFGIKSVSGGTFEADDFACSYARIAEKAGYKVTIVTGDRDLFQLSSENIHVAIPHKGYQEPEYMGPGEILKKYGVTPAQIPAYKGLVGDSSDNLPGVKGIGPVAAASLLQEYGSLESIYEHLQDIKTSWRTKLEEGREQAFFCQRMAVLKCDIEPQFSLSELECTDISAASVLGAFRELEFTLLTKRFQAFLATPYGQERFRRDVSAEFQQEEAKKQTSSSAKKDEKKDAQLTLL